MKKHGFTLVEMLGILVVLSIIVVISVPAITSSLKKADQQRYDDWLDSLYIAAEEYVESHREDFYEVNAGATSYLSIQQLLDQGYLKESVKDPDTGNDITDVAIVKITVNEDQTLKYELVYKSELDEIVISVGMDPDPNLVTWTSKDVTVTIYAEASSGMRVNEYSFDGGKTWQKDNKKTVSKNQTLTVLARDSRFDSRSASKEVKISHIDKTAPSKSEVVVNLVSTKSIAVRAECYDAESGITKYQFSKDNGKTWTDESQNSSYKFDNLTTGTYPLKVRCINGAGLKKDSATKSQKTQDIDTPKCTISPSSGWTRTKNINIDFGVMPANSKLTYQYQLYTGTGTSDGKNLTAKRWVTSATQDRTVTVSPTSGSSTASVLMKVTDGVNTKVGSTCTATQLDIDKPTCTITPNTTSASPTLTLTINYSDKVGAVASSGYSWTSASSGFSSTKTKKISANGTYNAWVKDQAGNVGSCSKNITNIKTTYSITYKLNGGTNHASNPSSYKVGVGATLYNPWRTGYTFAGWYTNSGLTNRITSISKTQTGNVTLYAKWNINKYTVKFVNGLGTTLKTQTVNYGGSATPPSNPTRSGYTFAGWSGSYTNVTSNRTITATWRDTTPPSCPKLNYSGGSTSSWKKGTVKMWYTPNSDIKKVEWFTNSNPTGTSLGSNYKNWGFKTNCGSSSTTTCTLSGSGLRRGMFRVYDAAGNHRDCYGSTFKVDNAKPTITCSVAKSGDRYNWSWKTTNTVYSGTRYQKIVVGSYTTKTYPTTTTGYGWVYDATKNPWRFYRYTKFKVTGTTRSNAGTDSAAKGCG